MMGPSVPVSAAPVAVFIEPIQIETVAVQHNGQGNRDAEANEHFHGMMSDGGD